MESASHTGRCWRSRTPARHGVFALGLCAALLLAVPRPVHAEYIVLRSGARIHVTGYEFVGDKYRLQVNGGTAEVLAEEVVGIEPEEIFDAIPEPLTPKTPFHDIIHAAAGRYGIDADLIHCVIALESNFDPKAVSRKNARGLMQLLPETAAKLGVQNIFDPAENIDAGAHYLKDLLARYNNNLNLALAAYNAGPERVEQYGRRVPPYPETLLYVQKISRNYTRLKADSKRTTPPAFTVGTSPSGR